MNRRLGHKHETSFQWIKKTTASFITACDGTEFTIAKIKGEQKRRAYSYRNASGSLGEGEIEGRTRASSASVSMLKGAVTRGNFFLQLATQRRFKLHFTREIASCNASSFQNNPTAGHTTCICLQFYRSLQYLFHPNLRCKLQEKIASCDSALSYICLLFFCYVGFQWSWRWSTERQECPFTFHRWRSRWCTYRQRRNQ